MLEPEGGGGGMIPRNAKYKQFDEGKEELFLYIRDVRLKKDIGNSRSRKISSLFYTWMNRLFDNDWYEKKKGKEREIYRLKATKIFDNPWNKIAYDAGIPTFANHSTRFMGPGDKEVTYQVLQIDVPTHRHPIRFHYSCTP